MGNPEPGGRECTFRNYVPGPGEKLVPDTTMAAEEMDPPVKSGNGDLPVITELADRAMTMEV